MTGTANNPEEAMRPMPASTRSAVVCNVPLACNRATAAVSLSSPLLREEYQRLPAGRP